MKIHGIHTTNFRLHADTGFALFDGVTGIIGPNEAGKSTILEAILWSLFGTKATRGTKESLRWHGAPERRGASVMLEFEIGGRLYRIERGESNAKLVMVAHLGPDSPGTAPGGTVLAEGTSGVDDFVPTLLGMTHDEFRASFLCSQKDLARISSMGPTERQTFIRQVLGVGRIDDALGDCRKRKNELASEVQGMDAGLGERAPLVEEVDAKAAEVVQWEDTLAANQGQLEQAKQAYAEAAEFLELSSAVAKKAEELAAAHRQAEKDMATAQREAERLTDTRQEQEQARERIAEAEKELAALPGLKERRDRLKEAKATLSERMTLTERAAALPGEIAHEREVIADAQRQIGFYDADEHRASNERSIKARQKLEGLRDARRAKHSQAMAAHHSHTHQAEKLEEQLAQVRELGADGACPTCTQRLGDALVSVTAALAEQAETQRKLAEDAKIDADVLLEAEDDEVEAEVALDAVQAELEVWRTRERDAERAREVITTRSATAEKLEAEQEKVTARLAELPDVDFDADDLLATQNKILVLENKERALVSSRGLVAQSDHTEAELARWREAYAKAEQAAQQAWRSNEALDFDRDRHKEIVEAEATAKATLEERRIAAARCEETLKAKRDALAEVEAAVKRYDSKAEALRDTRHALRVHEQAATGLADFRTAVAGTIRPELEELMSGFVHILTDGRHEAVTLSDDFTPVLLEQGIPTEVVSGGTEDIAALAMRLAISQMIAERAGHPIESLVLDEPFGGLDEVRRGNVLNLIRRLGGVFEQVIVISHVAETRDAVDHVVELEYDETAGMTRVVASPSAMEAA